MKEKIEQATLGLTAIIGILISLLDLFGLLENVPALANKLPTISLLSIGLIMGYLTLERRSKLDNIERLIDKLEHSVQDEAKKTIIALGGVSVISLTESEIGLDYLARRILESKNRIDLASFVEAYRRDTIESQKWEKAIERVLLSNSIRFRYVCAFDEGRLNRVKKHLSNPKISKFFVGYFPANVKAVPIPGFLVLDEEEVIITFPQAYGTAEVWLSIKHPEVLRMFIGYFGRLWGDSNKITSANISDGSFEKISTQ